MFSPYFSDVISFEFELNGISIDDGVGKDVAINWKFDDFEDGQTFWTDSNGLEMQKKSAQSEILFRPRCKWHSTRIVELLPSQLRNSHAQYREKRISNLKGSSSHGDE
jgi:hypothetical protein